MDDVSPDDDAYLWVDCLKLTPGILTIYMTYIGVQSKTAQKAMDAAIDAGDLFKAARAKGERDAYDRLLHCVQVRAQGA